MNGLPPHAQERAAQQHGIITRRQLTASGYTAGNIDGWRRRGHLVGVAHGVYRIPGAPRTPQQFIIATVLRAGTGAKAGPRTSAALHRLEGFTLGRGADVVVPPARKVTAVPFQVHRFDVGDPDETTLEAIPALTAARTLIEIADSLPDRRLRIAVDSARRRQRVSLEQLVESCERLGHRPGAAVLGAMLEEGVFALDSEGERTLRETVFLGLDWQLEGQVTDLVPGRRLDLAERLSLMGFEYDSRAHHVLPTDRDNDGMRDLESADHGVLIVRITAGMIRRHLEETRERIIRIRERRLRELGIPA
jgi:Transcriptional regulator, AbiEi antitoxin